MNSRVALITFLDGVSDGRPDNTLPTPPAPGVPTPPIYYPPGIWPTPPTPQPPVGIWPTPNPPRPDNTLPGAPGHPWFPGHVPPIGATLPVFPPVGPDNTLPPSTPPPTISLPIYFPPQINPTPPVRPDQKFELKYSPVYGWVLVPVGGNQVDNTLPPTAEPKDSEF